MMDDLILTTTNTKSNLLNLKGKDWSSLQNLDNNSQDSEETSFSHQNGYLNQILVNVNGVESDETDLNSEINLACVHNRTKHQDTTKLNKDDMCIYGLRPAYDQFYLVVCEFCKKVVKPQALSKHIEIRHSNKESEISNNTYFINSIKQERGSGEEESHLSSLTEDELSNLSNSNTNNLRSLLATKDDLDLEGLKHKQQPPNHLLIRLDSVSKSNSSNNSTSASSSPLNENIIIKRTRPKLLPCKDRKYDPDKHCGVKLTGKF